MGRNSKVVIIRRNAKVVNLVSQGEQRNKGIRNRTIKGKESIVKMDKISNREVD